jgi:hypothetical protein
VKWGASTAWTRDRAGPGATRAIAPVQPSNLIGGIFCLWLKMSNPPGLAPGVQHPRFGPFIWSPKEILELQRIKMSSRDGSCSCAPRLLLP